VINKSKCAIVAAVAVDGVTSPAPAVNIRNFASLLFIMARRFYNAHMQKVQMRLAPTRRLGRPQLRRICNMAKYT
jgi:hypothetical protein